MPPNELRDYLQLPYSELEELNLKAKQQRADRVPDAQIQAERLKYLVNEDRIKAVSVLFSDLEGRLHTLDYDKKFLVKSADNLTFDGSSIRGFTPQRESDLRLALDWSAFYWVPSDVFGPGKVLVFADVLDRDGTPFAGDLRGQLKKLSNDVYAKEGYTLNAANEIEGFLFKGLDAERRYHETGKFEYVNTGGYYHSLRVIRCAPSSTRSRKSSARWASRTKRTIPRSRPRSSRSTTATVRSLRRPTRFSSTS
jgi:glutamine synthetase